LDPEPVEGRIARTGPDSPESTKEPRNLLPYLQWENTLSHEWGECERPRKTEII